MQLEHDVALEDQIRECFGRVVYSHKTHERMADICATKLNRYKVFQIVLSAATSTSAVGAVVADKWWLEVATALISFLTLFVTTYLKNFDLGGTVQKHREAAAKLWNVRECYLSLLTDLPTLDRFAAVERRDELQTMLAALYQAAPQTNGKAYSEAQKRLQKMEDLTFSADEIDCFLPLSLKRSGGRPTTA
ncbi:SLATT domain-containing protein [Rhizobium sp. 'Codium 1']|uniref:SLATT domain-containing protein n=1 Tax=Rhizobium sp. 'Codium 1' TaxID=2940484 RepID=UPI001E5660BD|nr:SLATT domain-containing protein [Rhizobium sp. 'Codium 1']MCC8932151.1 SLATT domain-containing protein [Rhizobium sp. 'Codium 1']